MKKIEATFLPSKLDEVRATMFDHGVHRFLVTSAAVHEYEHPHSRWSTQSTDEESPTAKLEAIVTDETAVSIARAILGVARTRHPTATVTISPVDDLLEGTAGQKPAAPKMKRQTPSREA